MTDADRVLRRAIKTHLAQQDITAKEFAARLCVSPAYLSMVMNGKKPPSGDILAAIGFQRLVTVRYLPVKKCL